MPIKIIEGNLLNADQDIITHQVNCQGSFGAGLAKQIANKYSKAKREYFEYCNFKEDKKSLLGDCLLIETSNHIVANLFAQYYYGSYGQFYKENGRQTDYKALTSALKTLKRYSDDNNLSVAIPFKMGCGLAKGDWDLVKNRINHVFNDKTVYVYELKEE